MKKSRSITAVLALAMTLATMFVFTACGPDTIKGEGGIAPEGYYEVGIDGSTFFLPSDFKKQSSANGMSVYTFGEGNFNVISAPIQKKAKDYTKKFMNTQYEMASSAAGVDMSVHIDDFKMYKLSGLLIVYVENTTTYNTMSRVLKQYQFVYDTDTRQISLTLTFNTVAEGEASDIPQNILHSISI
ncbi:MAG: hypothetical protein K2M95_07870 [Clostridiales bacterium]|nr:hypothetical protein [Clostridiales bacterium]